MNPPHVHLEHEHPPQHGERSCCHGGHASQPVSPTAGSKYFCPMCPGIESDKPGSCPKCGMALERNPAWKPSTAVVYTCPMHPEVRQAEPGNCPKCGMALEPIASSPDDDEGEDAELQQMTRRLVWSAILTLPVFIVAMAHLVPAWSHAAWANSAASRWM